MKTTFHEQPRKSLISIIYICIYIYIYHVLACLPQHICPGSSRSNVQRSASLRQNGSWPVGPQPGRGVSQRKTSSSTTGVNLGSAAGGVSPLITTISSTFRLLTRPSLVSESVIPSLWSAFRLQLLRSPCPILPRCLALRWPGSVEGFDAPSGVTS